MKITLNAFIFVFEHSFLALALFLISVPHQNLILIAGCRIVNTNTIVYIVWISTNTIAILVLGKIFITKTFAVWKPYSSNIARYTVFFRNSWTSQATIVAFMTDLVLIFYIIKISSFRTHTSAISIQSPLSFKLLTVTSQTLITFTSETVIRANLTLLCWRNKVMASSTNTFSIFGD